MKLSTLTVQQKFILRLLEENPTFRIKESNGRVWMFEGNSGLFLLNKRGYENLKILKLI